MVEIAVFWDYENIRVVAKGINVPLAESLIEYCLSIGHPHVKKVYCDWVGVNKTIIKALYSLGFDAIQVSMGKTNSVDVKLAVDCLDIAQLHPSIEIFIIITGDKDFIPVVNWLKAHGKRVIIISKLDVVSEHLLLSADDFISLEELSKMYKARGFIKKKITEEKTSSFEDAIQCLLHSIASIRELGKSTRFGMIDNFMRSSPDFDYRGAKYVLKPDKSETFSTFSKFIDAAEKKKKIKTETIEGFKEIFLLEENPQEESEFSPIVLDAIDKKHWNIIFELIIKAITTERKEDDEENQGKFMYILRELRVAKKDKRLSLSHRIIKSALVRLIEIGFLIKQPDEKYLIVKDGESNIEEYIDKVIKSL